jgi:hypothetical protein
LVKVSAGKFEPPREGVATNNRGAEGQLCHGFLPGSDASGKNKIKFRPNGNRLRSLVKC